MAEDDLAFVEAAYARVCGRAVDPVGLAHALHQLRSGKPRDAWLAWLSDSSERPSRDMFGNSGHGLADLLSIGPHAIFVGRALQALVGERPTKAWVDAQVARLAAGLPRWSWLRELRRHAVARGHRASLHDVHLLDLDGAECRGHVPPTPDRLRSVSDEGFVQLAYLCALGREPDARGRAGLLARLRRGERRLDLLVGLARSPEGRSSTHGSACLDRLGLRDTLLDGWTRRLRRYISLWRPGPRQL